MTDAGAERAARRIADLRFGIKLMIEKAQYDEYEGAWRRIVQLGNEILATDDLAALPPASEEGGTK